MTNRRQYLVGAGTAAAALLGVGTNTALAQSTAPKNVRITHVDVEREFLVVENRGTSPFDFTGYHINFEHDGTVDQIREFGPDTTVPDGGTLTLEAGGRFVVATGAKSVPRADVSFDYKGPVLNDDESDAYAILTPDEERVVALFDRSSPESVRTSAAIEVRDERCP